MVPAVQRRPGSNRPSNPRPDTSDRGNWSGRTGGNADWRRLRPLHWSHWTDRVAFDAVFWIAQEDYLKSTECIMYCRVAMRKKTRQQALKNIILSIRNVKKL